MCHKIIQFLHRNSKGETLIELVLSIALFSISILTVMTMFLAGQKLLRTTSESERNANQMINELVEESSNITKTEHSISIQFQDAADLAVTENVTIKLQKLTINNLNSQQKSFYKWKYGGQ